MEKVSTLNELVEILQIDQSRRWHQGEQIQVEAYLERYPELRSNPDCVLDLLSNEMVLREESGQEVLLDTYSRRFPELVAQLSPLIEVHRALKSGEFDDRPTKHASSVDGPVRKRTAAEPLPEIPGYEVTAML